MINIDKNRRIKEKMKQFVKKTLSLLLTLLMMLSVISVTTMKVKAVDPEVGSSWTVNADGTLSISETAATKAVGNMTKGKMILIGTKGGKISNLPSDSGITTKLSSAQDAALIHYDSNQDIDVIKNMLITIKFSSDTTQVHIDVTNGDTNGININNTDSTFGILNANDENGEAHAYKYVTFSNTESNDWISAFNGAVTGTDTLGGLKGYLATITSKNEATLLNSFYNTVSSGNSNGAWIAGTSLRYSTNKNANYEDVKDSKITTTNYEFISKSSQTPTNHKIVGTNGAYYWTNTYNTAEYKGYYYWACGPEAGQTIPDGLWKSGEPNNHNKSDPGENSVVASYSNSIEFNDFPTTQGVPGYFLEFSAYPSGLADRASYNSITIYKVTLYGNGATGTVAPMEKFKGESLILLKDQGGLTGSAGNTWFAGWYENTVETNYNRILTYDANAPTTFYAHWSQYGYTSQYDPVAKTGLVYNGTSQLLIDTTDGHGIWRVNAPTDSDTGSFTYWYSQSEGSGYKEGSVNDSSKTANEGYVAAVKTDCTPLYETNAGTYKIYWNWNYQEGTANKGYITTTIEPKSINDNSINVSVAPDDGEFIYNKEAQAPIITIKDTAIGTDGIDLAVGTDYEINYEGTDATEYTSDAAPTNVGTYKAIITGKGNYKESREIAFTIKKAEVVAPTITEKHYTGKNLTADVEEDERYEVTENEGGIEVGNYDVVLTLKDTVNYKWIDNEETEKTLIFKIVPEGTNIVTVNLEGWTYGETANKPTSTATFGNDTVVYSYSSSLNGEYTSEMPKDAGVYYIKANIEATENYGAGEAINHFEIKEANSVASKVTANNRTYDKTKKPLVNVDNTSLYGGKMFYALGKDATGSPDVSAYVTAIPEATDAGTYYVWYRLIGDENYKDIEAACVTVTIEKKPKSVNAEVKKSEDAPDVKVSNLNNELALKLLTDEEKDEYEKGDPVNVYLTIDAIDRSKVPAVDLAVVDKIISDDGYTYGQCLDLSLWKKVGDNEAVQIHDTNGNPIMLQITVPNALQKAPDGYKRTFKIIRVHDSVPTVLAEGDGPTFEISLDKFSSYFIIYKDVKVEKKSNSITTGDKMNIGIVIMAMIDSVMTAIYLTLRRRNIK